MTILYALFVLLVTVLVITIKPHSIVIHYYNDTLLSYYIELGWSLFLYYSYSHQIVLFLLAVALGGLGNPCLPDNSCSDYHAECNGVVCGCRSTHFEKNGVCSKNTVYIVLIKA